MAAINAFGHLFREGWTKLRSQLGRNKEV